MASYLVTGTSRGIGLEVVRRLLALPKTQVSSVFAVTRSQPSAQLKEIIDGHSDRVDNVIIDDLTDETQVRQAASTVEEKLGGKGLDVLVNNAGMAQWSGSITNSTKTSLVEHFLSNTVTTHVMTKAFLDLLHKGQQKKVINISTTLSSLVNAEATIYAKTPEYKISKAAMNMLNQQYAADFKEAGFTFMLLSPGWVKTDLGGKDHAHLTPEQSGRAVVESIQNADTSKTGRFFNVKVPEFGEFYKGEETPW